MNLRKVVVTGIGTLTPVGNCVPIFWDNIVRGVSGANPITHFDTTNFKTKFACELKNFDILDYLDKKETRKIDPSVQYALIASEEAINDSNFLRHNIDKERIGVIIGSGIGGVPSIEECLYEYFNGNKIPRFSPFFIPKVLPDMISGVVSIHYGFQGPNYTTISACASSANAIVDACHFIQLGKTDIMVTGGSEACICAPVIGGFNSMHALSTRNEDCLTASRPYDLGRDGFVLGEGSGILILEEFEHALKRGAKIYAEVAGYGLSADAYHITHPHPEGRGAILSMKNAIQDANMQLTEIDYINTHGTSTMQGDLSECFAISSLFKEYAAKLFVSSTKSMTGHLLGAAAAIEAIIAILAINNSTIPATINQFENDPNIPNIGLVKNKAIHKNINTVLSNSFGFGGHNASLIFKKLN
jgi:3-oxoacyl-[acyl-carrier-protein] synthase II